MRILRSAVTGASWAVAAAVVVLPLVQPGGLLGPDLALASSALSVSGSITDLRPGVPAQLVLTVENADSRDVMVRRLTAEVVGGGEPGCSADALQITPWVGDLTVPARGFAQQALSVLLDERAQCDAVGWELRYAASGD